MSRCRLPEHEYGVVEARLDPGAHLAQFDAAGSGDRIGGDLATGAEPAQRVFEGPEFPVPAAERGMAVEPNRPRGIATVHYVVDARSPSRTVDTYTTRSAQTVQRGRQRPGRFWPIGVVEVASLFADLHEPGGPQCLDVVGDGGGGDVGFVDQIGAGHFVDSGDAPEQIQPHGVCERFEDLHLFVERRCGV